MKANGKAVTARGPIAVLVMAITILVLAATNSVAARSASHRHRCPSVSHPGPRHAHKSVVTRPHRCAKPSKGHGKAVNRPQRHRGAAPSSGGSRGDMPSAGQGAGQAPSQADPTPDAAGTEPDQVEPPPPDEPDEPGEDPDQPSLEPQQPWPEVHPPSQATPQVTKLTSPCGQGVAGGMSEAGVAAQQAPSSPFRLFSSSSVWNLPLIAGAAVDPGSAALVGALASTVTAERQAKAGPWINTTEYSIPVYTVGAAQPMVGVTLEKASSAPALAAAWKAVPLPANAYPARGTDGVLVVWQPSTDKLWDFWRLAHHADGWHASWGGAMQSVSASSGVYGPAAWPGAQSWWGDSASSMEPVGGLISLEDLACGVINHALGIALPEIRKGLYASPATRTDGASSNPLSLPEGARLRLNPKLDLASLHLPRVTLMIAEAAQRYGIYVRDGAHTVSLFAQDPTPTGTEPYSGPAGYFQGMYPSQLLTSFPWSQLELLKMDLHAG